MEHQTEPLIDIEPTPPLSPGPKPEQEATREAALESVEALEGRERRRPSTFSFELKALGKDEADAPDGFRPASGGGSAFPWKPSGRHSHSPQSYDHFSR